MISPKGVWSVVKSVHVMELWLIIISKKNKIDQSHKVFLLLLLLRSNPPVQILTNVDFFPQSTFGEQKIEDIR